MFLLSRICCCCVLFYDYFFFSRIDFCSRSVFVHFPFESSKGTESEEDRNGKKKKKGSKQRKKVDPPYAGRHTHSLTLTFLLHTNEHTSSGSSVCSRAERERERERERNGAWSASSYLLCLLTSVRDVGFHLRIYVSAGPST